MARTKTYITLLISFLLFEKAYSQPYGNEWIDQNQSYFKIKIGKEGIYRISRTELSNGGFPVGSVDPRRIQLFHHGIEQAIQVDGQEDGSFDSNDYIEFYAKAIDGTSDTPLYVSPEAQPHQYYNLFSDTTAYFLTYKLNLESGKRMEQFYENNTGGLPEENYFIDEDLTVFSSNFYEGQSSGPGGQIVQGYYDLNEGWTGNFATRGQSLNNTITGLIEPIVDDVVPHLELLLAGGNNNAHNIDIFVGINSANTRLLTTAEFSGDAIYLVNEDLLWSDISPTGDLFIQARINGVDGIQDRAAISYIKVSYSRGFNLDAISVQSIKLKPNPSNKSFVEIQNIPNNSVLYDITDAANPIVIGYNENAGDISAIVNNTASNRRLFLQSNINTIPNINPVSFSNINASLYDYLIITHESLRENTSNGQSDQTIAYKDYRESVAGGGHSVLISNIDQLFDQFNYGEQSPLAIRRFCQYMYDNGTPEFLFIIGKASNVAASYYRRNLASSPLRHFVPTFGYPGADVPFSEGLDGGTGYESLATGRINADSPDDIQNYLNKVIEEESLPFDNLRQKNLVHLSGGNTENELQTFKNYINGFANTAAGKQLGGKSAQISKNNNSAVELINISDEINDGVMMVTFFGHSSGSVTDIEIGLVSDPSFGYSNKGKYPIFMVNGCLAGDFFSEKESFGVDWILTPDRGALAFMAHSHVAFSGNLKRYTDTFYELAFNDPVYVTKTVGEIKRETARQFIDSYGTGRSSVSQVQLINLQGDPAVKVFGADKPDFNLDENLIKTGSFNNDPVLATLDSFYLELNVKNFGIYTDSTMNIQVIRTLPDGSSINYGPLVYDPVLREDTIQFVIDNNIPNTAGSNSFQITIDPFDAIDELNETNNTANIDVFLSEGSTLNLLPTPYAIEDNSTVDFFFQSSNLLTDTRDYDFQLDTIPTFNSSFFISQTINAKVITSISVDLESQGVVPNKKVFYWRTRFSDPLPNESDKWVTSSFTLDRNMSEGWAQQKPFQLSELSSEGITIDPNTGFWEFITTAFDLDVKTYGSNHSSFTFSDTEVLLNGKNYFITSSTLPFARCATNTINFLAFKRQSTAPFRPLNFAFADELNSLVCGSLPQYILNYSESDMTGDDNPNEYINGLENGDKVLIYSLGTVAYSTWTDEFKTNLETLGINRAVLDDLNDDEPIIFLGAKNATPNSAIVVRATSAPANEIQLALNESVIGNFDSGKITTKLIGPAQSWGELKMNVENSTNPEDDEQTITIQAVDTNGISSVFHQNSSASQLDLGPDGINLNASNYPYVRLILDIQDDVQFTPLQLKGWEIEYETSPEVVLLKNDRSDLLKINTKQEGEHFSTTLSLWNISEKDILDSVQVKYHLFNTEAGQRKSDSIKVVGLSAKDSVQVTLSINTIDAVGNNDLIIDTKDPVLKEIYTINNESRLTNFLRVEPDQVNPILEVSFDGISIMDKDIVSPNPAIHIALKDNNSYILKQDTLGINIYVKYPCEACDFVRIPFSSPYVTWASANENTAFQIDFVPEALNDGIHALRVQAVDGSGNESGLEPYEINFEVINQSTITNFYPYPNPFSSSTRFVFTLTGSEIPEDLKIQIMTVTGRVVKEIFMDELGDIRVGNNRTDYAWDGRDTYGDQLANGVYLYRVLIKEPGENFEHRASAGDRGFKNGFGKMYLLR